MCRGGWEERSRARVLRERRPGFAQVEVHGVGRAAQERHHAISLPLAVADEEDALTEVDVGEVEPLALAHAEAGAVEQLQDGVAPLASVCMRIRMGHEPPGLLLMEHRAGHLPLSKGEGGADQRAITSVTT